MRKMLSTIILLVAAMAAGFVGGLLSRSTDPVMAVSDKPIPEVIRAESFEVVDADGKTHGAWVATKNAVALQFFNASGLTRLELKTLDTGTILRIAGADGKPRVSLIAVGDPMMSFMDNTGQSRLFFGLTALSEPFVTLYDAKGKPEWRTP